ncbi:unnamed protein product, partial [Heligmosomoides polygyrus]|uniref:RMI1_N domain-containing protein n=1 Tax=Heligmosomoides polygyrus TaxID=6339 RepID=A0A183FYP7_HELPZ
GRRLHRHVWRPVALERLLISKENVSELEPISALSEKKVRQSQKVCLRCLAGEAGHITHVISEIAV